MLGLVSRFVFDVVICFVVGSYVVSSQRYPLISHTRAHINTHLRTHALGILSSLVRLS